MGDEQESLARAGAPKDRLGKKKKHQKKLDRGGLQEREEVGSEINKKEEKKTGPTERKTLDYSKRGSPLLNLKGGTPETRLAKRLRLRALQKNPQKGKSQRERLGRGKVGYYGGTY